MQSWSGVFQFGILFSVALSDSRCTSASKPSSSTCNYFSMLCIDLAFRVFLFRYFTPKPTCFLCIRSLDCPTAFSTTLLIEFSFAILECFILFVLLSPVSVSFILSLQVTLSDLTVF